MQTIERPTSTLTPQPAAGRAHDPGTVHIVEPRPGREGVPGLAPVLDVVVPVHDEEATLRRSIERLHAYLSDGFPFTWRITVVDNASSDRTWDEALAAARSLDHVGAVHLGRKGRGLALRTAWERSDAGIVAYMDVDLSTGLDALLPLVAPLVSGHSDVAIGSRLSSSARVARGPLREFVSRTYNRLLRTAFASKVHDAQCGFKALRADVARQLLPQVEDDGWFFDTELLLLADHNGLRIHEVPVDWVDDPDSRVQVVPTALGDLAGSARMARRFLTGRGRVDLGPCDRGELSRDMGRHLVTLASIGALSTLVSLAVYLVLRTPLGPVPANLVALAANFAAGAWVLARSTLGRRQVRWVRVMALFSGGAVVSSAALLLASASGAGSGVDLVVALTSWIATSTVRLAMLWRAGR